VAVDESNATKVARVIADFGFSASASPTELTVPNKIFRMGLPPVRIEVLTGVTGVEFGECYRRRVSVSVDGVVVNLISKADLIANKTAAGRHKDLADIEKLTE